MKTRLSLALGLVLFAAVMDTACAQDITQRVAICDPTQYLNPRPCLKPNPDGSLAISGNISTSLSGFTPNGNVASLSVSSVSSNVALPTGAVVAVANSGSADASIKLTVGAGSAATTDFILKAGATVGLTVGSNTFINAITSSGSTVLSLAGGSGLLSGYGGGGSAASGISTYSTTDKGGTLTAGNVAQNAIASNASRKAWCIQNDPTATETLFVRVNGTAGTTAGIALAPGGQACNAPGSIDTAAVSVFAATTGHRWYGFEGQ
jgi:hypothetical protein